MQLPHELLHGQKGPFVLKTQFVRHFLLIFKTQPIVLPTGQVVQVVSNEPDKVKVFPQLPVFIVGKFSLVFQISWRSQTEKGACRPENLVVVPQSSYPIFEIGLKEITCVSKGFLANLVVVFQPPDKLHCPFRDHFLMKGLHEGQIGGGISTQKSGIHHGRENFKIIPTKGEAIPETAHPIPQVNAQIPEWIKKVCRQLLGHGWNL